MMDMLLAVLAVASVVSVGLLFLPAFIELKKPRDAGPRLVADVFGQNASNIEETSANFEAEPKLDGASAIEDDCCIARNLKS